MDLSKIDLTAGVKFPGEDLMVALLDFAQKTRETMDPDVRKKWDLAVYNAYRDWNNFWVKLGWPGTELPL